MVTLRTSMFIFDIFRMFALMMSGLAITAHMLNWARLCNCVTRKWP
eukprot:SAG31_NODE_37105_length_307_cov_0.750000_1_plen_45_part_10